MIGKRADQCSSNTGECMLCLKSLVLSLALAAALPTAFAVQAIPRVLDGATKAGVKIVKQFPAASGLTGWVLAQGGSYSIVYTTADKKTLIAGALFDEQGRNLSKAYEDTQLPQPDLGAAYASLDTLSFVADGGGIKPKRLIYVFVDANCPYCHLMWQAVQPYQAAGLQVRWIPVAVLGPTSMPKAISILGAKDKAAAFRQMEENHGKPWTAPADAGEAPQAAIAASVRRNGEAMEAFGIGGTPGIVWRDKQGRIKVKSGMPRLAELPAMTGLPPQANSNPALDKFK